jgi:predicted patatin/cPLA2 family phospholipase
MTGFRNVNIRRAAAEHATSVWNVTNRVGRGPMRHAPGALLAPHPPSLLPASSVVADPVLRVVLERAREESRPGSRDDDHVVCLAVEGGGMRGAVSAGMCVVLEAAGLVTAFDRVYGVSAGALNGCALAAGQAALSATYYQDAATRRVINRMRPLLGRPVIDFDLLFDDVIGSRKPLSFDALSSGPEFRALATSLETLSLRVLRDFADIDEAMDAVRASGSLPGLGGPAPVFRGERMTDGGLIEPIPVDTAIAEGATHVLVLRSRPAGYRKPALSGFGGSIALRNTPELLDLLKERDDTYNRQAGELERGPVERWNGAHVLQVAVPDHTRLIRRLEADNERVVDALRLGAKAMARAVLTETVDLCWQPVVYRATSGGEDRTPHAVRLPLSPPRVNQPLAGSLTI